MLPSWQETFLALQEADTIEELWSVLLSPHGIRSSSVWEEPFLLFSRFHRDGAGDAVGTAVLLCTDHRWRKASHRLIGRLADSTILNDGDLDEISDTFLEPDVTIEFDNDMVLQRQIWPPLRRWAAARRVTQHPSAWAELLELAQASPSADRDAIAAGVIDSADVIPFEDRARVLEAGLGWGSGMVRLAALPAYARLVGIEAATARAADDTSATVRRWSPNLNPRSSSEVPGDKTDPVVESPGASGQPSLFDMPVADE